MNKATLNIYMNISNSHIWYQNVQGCQHLLAKKFQVISGFSGYFGPFFKVFYYFSRLLKVVNFPSGHIQRFKSTQRVVSEWYMTCLSGDLKHGLLYTNSTMGIKELFLLFSQQDWIVISLDPRRHVFMWIQMAFLPLKKENVNLWKRLGKLEIGHRCKKLGEKCCTC